MSRNPGKNRKDNRRFKEKFIVNFQQPARMANNIFVGYPSSYRTGMSNLGFHFIFKKLKSRRLMRVERFFTDTSPFTFESGLKISSSTALFITLSYEEDYLNLVRILIESEIEPSREKRRCRPIIILGGPAVSANPAPMSEVADIIAIGEGEEVINDIADFVDRYGGEGCEKIADKLRGIEGIFVSGQSAEGVELAHPGNIDRFPVSAVLSSNTAFSDMLLMEISRGCTGNCCFCLASAIYSPLRIQRYESIMAVLGEIPEFVRKVGLVSTSVTSHPDFNRIVGELIKRGIKTSFSSLKAEDIDADKALMIGKAGANSVALAPETGSEDIRYILGKKVPDRAYFNAARLLSTQGISKFTLYLISGYPGESEKVIRETELFIKNFKRVIGKATLSVHINVVVPKAQTPLQFYALPEKKNLEMRLGKLAEICESITGNVRVKSIRGVFRQAVLSLGDEDVGKAVIKYGRGGISWKKALRNSNVDPEFIHDKKRLFEFFPWDHITGKTKRDYLFKRFEDLINLTG